MKGKGERRMKSEGKISEENGKGNGVFSLSHIFKIRVADAAYMFLTLVSNVLVRKPIWVEKIEQRTKLLPNFIIISL